MLKLLKKLLLWIKSLFVQVQVESSAVVQKVEAPVVQEVQKVEEVAAQKVDQVSSDVKKVEVAAEVVAAPVEAVVDAVK